MNFGKLISLGLTVLVLVAAAPALADIAPPPAAQAGGTSTAAAGSGATPLDSSSDDNGCSVAFVRNSSATAAGLIFVALALGMNRLRRYGMR